MHKRIAQTVQKLTARLTRLHPLKKREATGDTPALTLKRSALYKGALALTAAVLAVVMLFAMTAAWYKNVVQTSGLLFRVDQWGLESSVSVQDELIGAGPGDSGMIHLTVENTSDGIIDVELGVSKGDMYNDIADMRKRLSDRRRLSAFEIEQGVINIPEQRCDHLIFPSC